MTTAIVSGLIIAGITGLVTVAVKYPKFYNRIDNGLAICLFVIYIALLAWGTTIQFVTSQVCYEQKSVQEIKGVDIANISDSLSGCFEAAKNVQSNHGFSSFSLAGVVFFLGILFLAALGRLPAWLQSDSTEDNTVP